MQTECKNCGNTIPRAFKDRISVCKNCRLKIESEIPLEIKDFTDFDVCLEFENKKHKYKVINYKGLEFYYFRCDVCGKWFYKSRNHLNNLINVAENDQDYIYITCSNECQIQSFKSKGKCSVCGKINFIRDQNSRGVECGCSSNWYKKHNSSENMKHISSNNILVWNNSEEGRKFNKELAIKKKDLFSKPGKCLRCGKECKELERNIINGFCKECVTSLGITAINKWNDSEEGRNFKHTFFKEKSKKFQMPGKCTTCGKFCLENERNIMTGQCKACNKQSAYSSIKSKHEIFQKTGVWPGGIIKQFTTDDNGILLYFDNALQKYVSWESYKNKFRTLPSKYFNDLPNDFFWISTFRDQSSDSWKGSKKAFEQNLVDNGIYWFVYIKFYVDVKMGENSIKPLVVGKSGSLLVNSHGSDVLFSEDPNDGPARRFLKEEGLQWYKEAIAVKKCDTEAEALECEAYIMKEYNLFGS